MAPESRSSMTFESHTHDAAAAASPRLTVLVVDDDPAILDATRALLEDEGFEAVGAANGEGERTPG
jgi:PleD family two-component response regulator